MKSLRIFVTIVILCAAVNVAFAEADLFVTVDSNNPPASQLVMGSMGNRVLNLLVLSTTYNPIILKGMNVFQATQNAQQQADFTNMQAYLNGQVAGVATTSVQSVDQRSGYLYHIAFSSNPVIPPYAFVNISIAADVLSYGQAVTDGEVARFQIVTTDDPGNQKPDQVVTATYLDNSAVERIHLAAHGSPVRVLRSTIFVSTAPLGQSQDRIKSPFDAIATITVTANPAGAISLTKLGVTFGGTAPNEDFLKGAHLIDENGVDATESFGAKKEHTTPCYGNNECEAKWVIFPDVFNLAPGSSYTFTLFVDDDNTNPYNGQELTLTATIEKAGDVQYADGLGTAILIGLQRNEVPIAVNSISYAP